MAARRGKGRSQARRPSSRGRIPGWAWLLGGLVIGLGLAAVVLVRQGYDASQLLPRPNPAAEPARPSEEPVAQPAPTPARKPRYDFYTLLPEKEVVIPDAEVAERAREPEPDTPAAGERYLLQVGAFRDPRDADALKAQLALLGMVARVEPAAIDGTTWHRVRLGPYEDLARLDAARRQLAQNRIEAIAIKAPL